jgi:hypothetical protein
MARARTICSVYFDKLKTSRPYRTGKNGGYRTSYEMLACGPDEYKLLVVEDAEELIYVGEKRNLPTPVYADMIDGIPGIAHDIAGKWQSTGIAEGVGGPGVMVIAGDTPTEEELASLRSRQAMWCRALIDQAEADWSSKNFHRVGPLHRKAARWMGELNYEWVRKENAPRISLKPCRFCRTEVDSTALICPACGHITDKEAYMREMAEYEKAGVPVKPETAAKPLPPPLKNPQNRVSA